MLWAFRYNTKTLQTDGKKPYDGTGRAMYSVARQKLPASHDTAVHNLYLLTYYISLCH